MKRSASFIFFYLAAVVWIVAGCVHQKPEGKHLFILAGQSNMAVLDPSHRFIPTLEETFGNENIIVVKDADVNKRIQRWYKKWQSPAGYTPADIGDLYDRLMKKVYAAIDHQSIATITFVWMQGESDATSAYYADIYEKNMYGLYTQLQEEFHRQDINWVIGRISDCDMKNRAFKRWTKIREIQEKVALSNPRFALVDTDDLNDGITDPKRKQNNDLHYSEAGFQILGQRFADSAIRLIKENDY